MLTRSLWNALRSAPSLRVIHIFVARHYPPADPLVEVSNLSYTNENQANVTAACRTLSGVAPLDQ